MESDSSNDDIYGLLRNELKEFNKQAVGSFYTSAHRSQARRTLWRFDFRRQWTYNKDYILNTNVLCPLLKRCSCPCQLKLVQTAAQIIMSIADLHTAQNHVKDKASLLTHQQRSLVATVDSQNGSHKQLVAASNAHPRLTYQNTRRCVEEFRSTHHSPAAIENHLRGS